MKICDKCHWVIGTENGVLKCGCWPLAKPTPMTEEQVQAVANSPRLSEADHDALGIGGHDLEEGGLP